jgi:hypothetical protein
MRRCGAKQIIIFFTSQFFKVTQTGGRKIRCYLLLHGGAEVVFNFSMRHGGVRIPHVLSYTYTYIYKIQLLLLLVLSELQLAIKMV